MEDVVDIVYHHRPCPKCGQFKILILWDLEATPLGKFSLSGVQMKTPAKFIPVLECRSCGVSCRGTIDPSDGKAVFHPEDFKARDEPTDGLE